ncbi:sensor histidine kinase [Kocuria soli]|nr:sensor histidine kinase [Kocuria soli]
METLAARWRASSLRTQLMALTGMLLAVSIVVTSFVAISVLRDSLINSIDEDLQDSLHSVSTALMSEMTGSPTETVPHQGFLLSEDGKVVAHVDATGTTTAQPDTQPDLSRFDREMVEQSEQLGITVPSANGAEGSWRVVAAPQSRTSYTVVVAEPLGDTNGLVSAITLLTLSFGAATLLAALVVGWVLITRAFQPLKKVEQTAAQIAEGDLSRRMAGYNSETEVGQLSMSLNRMLGHIEDAFDARTRSEARLRQFVADASHELRTPLVSIRGYSELYRHGALRDEEQVGQAMGRIESEATRMTQLVEDLLSLARLDSKRELATDDVDLLVLAHDAAADFAASSPDRSVTVTNLDDGPATPVWTRGEEAKLRQVVANLMTNAVRYTPKGSDLQILIGTVPLTGVPRDQRPSTAGNTDPAEFLAQIKVRDHGPGIKGADRAKVFERFYRADTSRTRETGGTGLGLSIVSAVIDQHGGTVTLEDTPGGGATFVVSLPSISTPEPPPETLDELPAVPEPTAPPVVEDDLPPIPEIDDDDPDIIHDPRP